ncbi:hypothetical protein GCM10022222_34370 [Amycolatopsis ultiminotia]|uniref:Secretory lipase n=1 Tax=Amycolatopsis ultiminotia TaxID=543629 RepID=A0ABP6WB35_9PSEU
MTISNRSRFLGALCTVAALCTALSACEEATGPSAGGKKATAAQVGGTDRQGEVVESEPLVSMDSVHLKDYLKQQGFDPGGVRYGVDAYRVLYRTTSVAGTPTVGSAVVAYPQTEDDAELPVTTYLHGTNPVRAMAASVADGPDRAGTLLFAGTGQATSAPDYPGLGLALGIPAYMQADPTVHAALDGVRATRALAGKAHHRLRKEVNVAGFSQGAQAAMAVGRTLQNNADPDSALGAIAAVSGPHDIVGTELPAAFDGRVDPHEAVVYLGYFVTAWNHSFHLYDSPSEAFQAPYDQTVESLFDGSHPFPEIIQGLPESPDRLLRPEFLEKLSHPSGKLAEAVEANDRLCAGWAPRGPVRLYHGTADKDVPYANSEQCRRMLAESGTKAELINAGPLDHNSTAIASFPKIADWFASLKG